MQVDQEEENGEVPASRGPLTCVAQAVVSLVVVQLHHGQPLIAAPAAKSSTNENHQADQDGQPYLSGALCCKGALPHFRHLFLSLSHPVTHIGDNNINNGYNSNNNDDSIHDLQLMMS